MTRLYALKWALKQLDKAVEEKPNGGIKVAELRQQIKVPYSALRIEIEQLIEAEENDCLLVTQNCKTCDHWHNAPRSKTGWCSGFTDRNKCKNEYCTGWTERKPKSWE